MALHEVMALSSKQSVRARISLAQFSANLPFLERSNSINFTSVLAVCVAGEGMERVVNFVFGIWKSDARVYTEVTQTNSF
jgi:hypothetical protein